MAESRSTSDANNVVESLLAELGAIVAAAADRSALREITNLLHSTLARPALIYLADGAGEFWLAAGGESFDASQPLPRVDHVAELARACSADAVKSCSIGGLTLAGSDD